MQSVVNPIKVDGDGAFDSNDNIIEPVVANEDDEAVGLKKTRRGEVQQPCGFETHLFFSL